MSLSEREEYYLTVAVALRLQGAIAARDRAKRQDQTSAQLLGPTSLKTSLTTSKISTEALRKALRIFWHSPLASANLLPIPGALCQEASRNSLF
jgi:hypothetical protein